jgi:uncharacterized membrane protein YhhN
VDGFQVALTIFAVATATALLAAERRRPRLLMLAKPAATLSLILVAGTGGPATFVALGLIVSAAGDVALLYDGRSSGAFVAGLLFFLFAQLIYAAAFLTGGAVGAAWTPLVGLAIFGVASAWLLRRLRAGAGPEMGALLIAYAAAITLMVAVAFSALGGPWPVAAGAAAAAGAVLFYLSDANLAWRLFRGSYPRAHAVTLALYWAGQLGIALAVRWAKA